MGPTGFRGDTGLPGYKGPEGLQGLRGEKGVRGLDGRNGIDAMNGSQGDMVLKTLVSYIGVNSLEFVCLFVCFFVVFFFPCRDKWEKLVKKEKKEILV